LGIWHLSQRYRRWLSIALLLFAALVVSPGALNTEWNHTLLCCHSITVIRKQLNVTGLEIKICATFNVGTLNVMAEVIVFRVRFIFATPLDWRCAKRAWLKLQLIVACHSFPFFGMENAAAHGVALGEM